MSTITDQSTIFSLTHLAGYTGQNSGSFGTQDFTGLTNLPFILSDGINSIAKVTTGFNTYYKVQGYNPIIQQYENWHSMGTPLLTPPSGNPLVNISIISTWTDR